MPGELDFGADGRANVFVVGETAWHREGVVLPSSPGFDEALRLARLDYEVIKVPLYRPRTAPGTGKLIRTTTGYTTVRTDRDTELVLSCTSS